MNKIIKILLLFVITLGFVGCTSTDIDVDKPTVHSEYGINERATTEDNVLITAMSTRTTLESGNIFATPEAGYEYFLIKVQIVNNSTETVNVSTIMSFELKDETGLVLDLDIFGPNIGTLDSQIPAGDTLLGEICYQTVIGYTGKLYLSFRADILSDKIKFVVK